MLSHSPMKHWLEDYKKKKVLVLGFNRYVDVAESYGFERLVTPSQLRSSGSRSFRLHFVRYRFVS